MFCYCRGGLHHGSEELYSFLNHMEENKELLCHIRIWPDMQKKKREKSISVYENKGATCFTPRAGV